MGLIYKFSCYTPMSFIWNNYGWICGYICNNGCRWSIHAVAPYETLHLGGRTHPLMNQMQLLAPSLSSNMLGHIIDVVNTFWKKDVFKCLPIKSRRILWRHQIKMFPKATGYHNVFRPAQQLHNRTILKASSAHSSADFQCPATLLLMMTCLCALFIKH